MDNTKHHQYLKAVTIGEPEHANDGIIIADYDPSWPVVYQQLAKDIDKALKGVDHTIEHVGSTSVPGLCAKPIIDILLLVDDPTNEALYVPKLKKLGYVLRIRERDWFNHRMLKHQDPLVNLHVFDFQCSEAMSMIEFRDWLIDHPQDKALYGQTKKALSKQSFEYVQDYANAKSKVVRTIQIHIFNAHYAPYLSIDETMDDRDIATYLLATVKPNAIIEQWNKVVRSFYDEVERCNQGDRSLGRLRKKYRELREVYQRIEKEDLLNGHAQNTRLRYEFEIAGKIMADTFKYEDDPRQLATCFEAASTALYFAMQDRDFEMQYLKDLANKFIEWSNQDKG